MSCCGINGPADYVQVFHNNTLPNSCCDKFPLNDPNKCIVDNAHKDGCMPVLLHFFESRSLILAGVGIGIAIIQVKDFFLFSCYSNH